MTPNLSPRHCSPAAYALFAERVPSLETSQGLLGAAVAIAMHEMPDVALAQVEAELDGIAATIRQRVRSRDPRAMLAHAHGVLFDEMGFRGDDEDYYHPRNSYVPAVLSTRRGLPITLTLVYKTVLERVGLRVHGIAAPAHFIAAVEAEGAPTGETGAADAEARPMLVDPFFGGRVVSWEEAARRVEQITGQEALEPRAVLPQASHREWIARMLQNLQGSFARAGREDDLAAMRELRALL